MKNDELRSNATNQGDISSDRYAKDSGCARWLPMSLEGNVQTNLVRGRRKAARRSGSGKRSSGAAPARNNRAPGCDSLNFLPLHGSVIKRTHVDIFPVVIVETHTLTLCHVALPDPVVLGRAEAGALLLDTCVSTSRTRSARHRDWHLTRAAHDCSPASCVRVRGSRPGHRFEHPS